jgi:hypothetical protein
MIGKIARKATKIIGGCLRRVTDENKVGCNRLNKGRLSDFLEKNKNYLNIKNPYFKYCPHFGVYFYTFSFQIEIFSQ